MRCKRCDEKLKSKSGFCPACGYYNVFDDEKKEKEEDIFADEVEIEKEEETSKEDVFAEDVEMNEEDNKDLWNDELVTFTNEEDIKKEEKKKPKRSFSNEEEYEYEEESYLESYIGEDYKIIKKRPFNIYAFLFNWMYVLYRKLYITGIVGLFLSYLVVLFLKPWFLIYVVIVMILLGFLFNPYYIKMAKIKINRIKNKFDVTDSFTLSNVCKEKGGVSAIPALVVYLVFLIAVILSLFPIRLNKNNNRRYWNENSENKATCISAIKASYSSLLELDEKVEVEEAACKIVKTVPVVYEIYIKIKEEDQEVISFFQTEEEMIVYQNDTSSKKELEERMMSGKITDVETIKLKKLQEMEKTYREVVKKSKEEDQLIQKGKNRSEKLHYAFTKEEVIR